MGTVSEQKHSIVVITLAYNPEGRQIESHQKPTTFCQVQISTYTFFWVTQILCFDQKIKNNFKNFCDCNMTSQSIESTTFVLPIGRWYRCATGVLSAWLSLPNFVIYRVDWLSIKFCENDSFRKLFLFFENTFQYPPIVFVSFTQPCDQHDRKIRTIRKCAARWCGRRAWGYRKLILHANLLYVPNIKM